MIELSGFLSSLLSPCDGMVFDVDHLLCCAGGFLLEETTSCR